MIVVVYALCGISLYLLLGLLAYLIVTRKAHNPKGTWFMMIFWLVILICWIIISGITGLNKFLVYIYDIVMTWMD